MTPKHKKYGPSFGHDLSKRLLLFVFVLCFSTVKIQVESLLAVNVMGILSGVHRFPMHSQLIDLKGAGTQQYRGQGICRPDLNLSVSRWMGWTVQSCWLVICWRPSWHGHHFNIPSHVFVYNLLSSLHFHTEEKASPLLLSSVKRGCWQLLPALTWPAGSQNPPVRA